MIHVGKINKQVIADAIILTFISLKFNLDSFLFISSPIIVNDYNLKCKTETLGACQKSFTNTGTNCTQLLSLTLFRGQSVRVRKI